MYDVNKYRHAITPQIKLWIDSRPGTDPVSHISNIALATSCPIIVVCKLTEEMYGSSSEELTRLIGKLVEFYG